MKKPKAAAVWRVAGGHRLTAKEERAGNGISPSLPLNPFAKQRVDALCLISSTADRGEYQDNSSAASLTATLFVPAQIVVKNHT